MFDPTGAFQGRPQEWRMLVPNVVSYSRCSTLLEPFKADLKSGECWFQVLCLIPDVRSYWSLSRPTSRVENAGSKCFVLFQMFDPTGAFQGRPQEWRMLVPSVVSYSRCSILLEPFKGDLKSGECWFQMLCLIPDVRSYWSLSRATSRVVNAGSKCFVLFQMFDLTGAVQGRPQEWRMLVPSVLSYSRCSILLEPFKADLKSGECWFQMLCLIPDVRSYWSRSRPTSRVANAGSKCCVLFQMFDPTGAFQGRPQEWRMLVPNVLSYSRCSILLEPFKADLKSGECWFQVFCLIPDV